jgi:hypothetical protein
VRTYIVDPDGVNESVRQDWSGAAIQSPAPPLLHCPLITVSGTLRKIAN